MAISKAQFKKIALSFPEAHEKPSYGSPAIFIAKKFFTRLRDEDDSIVWIVDSIDERDNLMELDPKTYFITAHYRDYPAILVRTSRISEAMLKKLLERRWRAIAPKKLLKDNLDPPAVIPAGRRKTARGSSSNRVRKTQVSKSTRR